jgi:hypothetical protein
MFALFGLLSGILSSLSYIPYIRDILRGKTKPERASFFIWSVLGCIAFVSQFAEGATWSLLLMIETFIIFAVFLLSLKFGVGGFTRRDIFALAVAGFGLILWFLTRHAFLALFITIGIDSIGTVLSVIKSYEDPESETISMWATVSVAGVLALFAVGKWDFVLLAYPLYIALANFAVVVAILLGRRKKQTLHK